MTMILDSKKLNPQYYQKSVLTMPWIACFLFSALFLRLRSSVTDTLVLTPTNCSTLGERPFSVAASRAWNGLPAPVRTAASFTTFQQQLKTAFY